jgi:hypothetical protein
MNAFSNPRRFASALNLFLNPDTQRWGCPGRVNFFLPQSKHVQKDNEQGIASDAEEVWGLGSRIIAARVVLESICLSISFTPVGTSGSVSVLMVFNLTFYTV